MGESISEPPALAGGPYSALRSAEDVETRPLTHAVPTGISVEHESKVLTDSLAQKAMDTAAGLSLRTVPVLSYLANSINLGERSIPYSLVTALDEESFRGLADSTVDKTAQTQSDAQQSSVKPESPIILNEWAARDLGAKPGDLISIDYYLWHEGGRLETKSTNFYLAAIASFKGLAADRDLVPEYPGITGSEDLSDVGSAISSGSEARAQAG